MSTGKNVAVALSADHKGMKVSYFGLLRQCSVVVTRAGEHGRAELLSQLADCLKEMGQRYYAGDVAAVDEFLQTWAIAPDARAVLKGGEPAQSVSPSKEDGADADDENHMTAPDGTKLVAKECPGCAVCYMRPWGSREMRDSHGGKDCFEHGPPCSAGRRKDDRGIIWVVAEGGEA